MVENLVSRGSLGNLDDLPLNISESKGFALVITTSDGPSSIIHAVVLPHRVYAILKRLDPAAESHEHDVHKSQSFGGQPGNLLGQLRDHGRLLQHAALRLPRMAPGRGSRGEGRDDASPRWIFKSYIRDVEPFFLPVLVRLHELTGQVFDAGHLVYDGAAALTRLADIGLELDSKKLAPQTGVWPAA